MGALAHGSPIFDASTALDARLKHCDLIHNAKKSKDKDIAPIWPALARSPQAALPGRLTLLLDPLFRVSKSCTKS